MAPRLLLGPFCAHRQRTRDLAFHDNFANVLSAAPLASVRRGCLSPSSSAWEGLRSSSVAIVWLGGSEETSLHTAGKAQESSACPGAGRSRETGPRWVGLGTAI